MYTLKYNSHKDNVSELNGALVENLSLQEKLQAKTWNRIVGQNWNKCTNTWLKQDDNKRELNELLNKYQKSTDGILDLLKEVIVKLDKMEALAIYRDFITMFLDDVEARFDKWVKARAIINRKLRSNRKVNYRSGELPIISELNDFLCKIHMTVEDVEDVMSLKEMSNTTFHRAEELETREAKEKLETLLPKELEGYESSLRKVLDALEYWDKNQDQNDFL